MYLKVLLIALNGVSFAFAALSSAPRTDAGRRAGTTSASSSEYSYPIDVRDFEGACELNYYPPIRHLQNTDQMEFGPQQYDVVPFVSPSQTPQHLEGQELVDFFGQSYQESKPWIDHIINLRLDLLNEAKIILPQIAAIVQVNDYPIDFTQYAGWSNLFGNYANILQALSNYNSNISTLLQQAREMKGRIGRDEYLRYHVEAGLWHAINQSTFQYCADLATLEAWTRPMGSCQVHSKIDLHRGKRYKDILKGEIEEADEIRRHRSDLEMIP